MFIKCENIGKAKVSFTSEEICGEWTLIMEFVPYLSTFPEKDDLDIGDYVGGRLMVDGREAKFVGFFVPNHLENSLVCAKIIAEALFEEIKNIDKKGLLRISDDGTITASREALREITTRAEQRVNEKECEEIVKVWGLHFPCGMNGKG